MVTKSNLNIKVKKPNFILQFVQFFGANLGSSSQMCQVPQKTYLHFKELSLILLH